MRRIQGLRSKFLEGLQPSEVAEIIARATERTFQANTLITREDAPGTRLFLMLHGRARGFGVTPQGEKVPMFWFTPGDIFGGAALMNDSRSYLLSTEAATNCTVFHWGRDTIRELATRFPRLHENGQRIAWDYLVVYKAHVISARCPAPQRIALVLATLAKGLGRQVAGGYALTISNEDLAREANVSPYAPSRMMAEWQRKGLIIKSRGLVIVRSPEELIRSEEV